MFPPLPHPYFWASLPFILLVLLLVNHFWEKIGDAIFFLAMGAALVVLKIGGKVLKVRYSIRKLYQDIRDYYRMLRAEDQGIDPYDPYAEYDVFGSPYKNPWK